MHAPLNVSQLVDAETAPIMPGSEGTAVTPAENHLDPATVAPAESAAVEGGLVQNGGIEGGESEIGPMREFDVAGNRIRLYVDTHSYVGSLVDDIKKATKRVWIESYIFAADELGKAVGEALKERAAAGVDCRVIYDAVGCYSTPAAFFADLQAAGVQVAAYRPLPSIWMRFKYFERFNRRDHRKMAVCDDQVAYFGGMNIVDQRHPTDSKPSKVSSLISSSGWRDVQARMEGPQQGEVAAAFDDLWKRIHRLPRSHRRRWPLRQVWSDRKDGIYFFDSRPNRRYRRPSKVLTPLIRDAKTKITLAMAYFIPYGSVLRELVRARRRGVRVRVIVPAHSDVRLVEWASRHMYERLIRMGIRIYERQDRMLHSKVMTIDDHWTVIGSCNIDPRSFLLNLEFMAVIRSAEAAAAVEAICRDELQSSKLVKYGHAKRLSCVSKWLNRFAWYFRRWL